MKLFVVLGALCAFGFSSAAYADSFNFSYTNGTDITVSGVLDATLTSPGTYLVTGISGTRNGSAIVSLDSVGGPDGNNNVLYLPEPFVDQGGIAFQVDGDPTHYDIFFFGGQYLETTSDLIADGVPVSLTVAATPEPSSLLLLGTGMAGVAGAFRRRYRQVG